MKEIAEVRLWDKQVGALLHNAESGLTTFEQCEEEVVWKMIEYRATVVKHCLTY